MRLAGRPVKGLGLWANRQTHSPSAWPKPIAGYSCEVACVKPELLSAVGESAGRASVICLGRGGWWWQGCWRAGRNHRRFGPVGGCGMAGRRFPLARFESAGKVFAVTGRFRLASVAVGLRRGQSRVIIYGSGSGFSPRRESKPPNNRLKATWGESADFEGLSAFRWLVLVSEGDPGKSPQAP
jgi:hypothetical protein